MGAVGLQLDFRFCKMMNVYSILFFTVIGVAVCQKGGGMAELKSITGDAPYSGVGNAPAPVPQPMGFWGRPKYMPSPDMDLPYGGGGGLYGGYGPYPYNRFTSISRSPYGVSGTRISNDLSFLALLRDLLL
ncbi:unnamed protein product [Caenorhabditis bovis]|uniref:Uncharacterized protein n=1 Tax=Caenorhabditis bovis TaxID=2654633 RepID=A0A8S1F1K2_9PELO|nr:unnamed protein product [Caenorhabditis bovis]